MIIELGHFALILALPVAVLQAGLGLAGAARGDWNAMAAARTAALAQFILIALAFATLVHAYVVSDFSVLNVAENSSLQKPLFYKLTSVWGNHEGSMVLWVLILSLYGAAVAWFGDAMPPRLCARVLGVKGLVAIGFLLFILFTSNPFLRLDPAPANGQGLNPILQDPGLAFHPPFLYLGYVGNAVAFAFAVAALIEGRVDATWARWVRPWTLASWCFLTVGIAMGSWWAYYTLGWGGWWFWDPVENASLMPWLAGTALIHSSIVVERRDTLKSWTVLLAILTFSLSLVGTFLVRSGVLTSVHAFALDPRRGVFILALLVVAIGGSLTLYAMRAPRLQPGGLFAPISREGALVLNNVVLAACCATVFIGTLYPLFLDAVGGPKLSVGYPFFDRTFVPLVIPLLLAVGIGPLLAWKRGDLLGALQRLWAAFAVAIVVVLIGLYVERGGPVLAVLGLGLAAWMAMAAAVEVADRVRLFRAPWPEVWRRAINQPRASYGMSLAHFGLAVTVAGISASAFQQQRIVMMHLGDQTQLAGYTLRFDGIGKHDGNNYTADVAEFTLLDGSRVIAHLAPQRRFFPLQQQTVSKTSIHTNLLADFYLALGDPDGKGGWAVRAYWKPLVPFIWIGGVIMAFGGAVSLSDRRWRVGVAARRAARAALPARGSGA
ncbi:MAG: heme lyase CcmF/NrfE family subunit [Alphaproteobacteria bacterium]|nr:heme lyase CcmF/NrfE family subunit [Alphaproteobacteria bacterium]